MTKIRAVNDLFENKNVRLEYLFSAGLYHNRWDELSMEDFVANPSKQKGTWAYGGGDSYFVPNPQGQFEIVNEKEEPDKSIVGVDYLYKIAKLCYDKDIKLILVNNPCVCTIDEQKYINYLFEDLANEYQTICFDFVHMNSVIDMTVDMMDFNHTNPSGMNKLSDFLGDYMTKKCDLIDHRLDKDFSNWQEDYEEFLHLKDDTIAGLDDPKGVLVLLHDDNYSSEIFICEGSFIYDDPQYLTLLNNIAREHVYYDRTDVASSLLFPLEKAMVAFEDKADYSISIDGKSKSIKESLDDVYKTKEYEIRIIVKNNVTGKEVLDKMF